MAVALVDGDGRVLLQRRPLEAVHGGLWEFPGGKVEAGETPEESAIRELAEELGVTLSMGALEPVGFASGMTAGPGEGGKGPPRPLVILLYACRIWSGKPEAHGGALIDWYEHGAIAGLAMPPLDYPLAEALGKRLVQYS